MRFREQLKFAPGAARPEIAVVCLLAKTGQAGTPVLIGRFDSHVRERRREALKRVLAHAGRKSDFQIALLII